MSELPCAECGGTAQTGRSICSPCERKLAAKAAKAAKKRGPVMADLKDGRRADLNQGSSGNRKGYGPAGCAGVVYGAAAVTALLGALLAKAVRR